MIRIDKKIDKWERESKRLEADLRDMLIAFAVGLQTKGGRLLYTEENLAKVSQLDAIMLGFNEEYLMPFVAGVYTELLKVEQSLIKYYQDMGLSVRKIKGMKILNDQIAQYLRQVATSNDTITMEMKDYLIRSIASRKRFPAVVKGIRQHLGKGETAGKLDRYLKTYLWDAVMKFYRIGANAYAEELGLNYFFYRGGLIETSRDFCIKKNDKLFHRDDALRNWPSDPDLPGDPLDYNPLVDLGRWNCRHYLEWVTDEIAGKTKKK